MQRPCLGALHEQTLTFLFLLKVTTTCLLLLVLDSRDGAPGTGKPGSPSAGSTLAGEVTLQRVEASNRTTAPSSGAGRRGEGSTAPWGQARQVPAVTVGTETVLWARALPLLTRTAGTHAAGSKLNGSSFSIQGISARARRPPRGRKHLAGLTPPGTRKHEPAPSAPAPEHDLIPMSPAGAPVPAQRRLGMPPWDVPSGAGWWHGRGRGHS